MIILRLPPGFEILTVHFGEKIDYESLKNTARILFDQSVNKIAKDKNRSIDLRALNYDLGHEIKIYTGSKDLVFDKDRGLLFLKTKEGDVAVYKNIAYGNIEEVKKNIRAIIPVVSGMEPKFIAYSQELGKDGFNDRIQKVFEGLMKTENEKKR